MLKAPLPPKAARPTFAGKPRGVNAKAVCATVFQPPGIALPTALSKLTSPRSIAGPITGIALTTSFTALNGAATALEIALKKYSGKPVCGLIVPDPPSAFKIPAS